MKIHKLCTLLHAEMWYNVSVKSWQWSGSLFIYLDREKMVGMAKEFARDFYDSKAWRTTRKAYARSVFGICERCGAPGEIVHHRLALSPENIHDDRIAFGFDNLELLCRECHNREHMSSDAISDGLGFTSDGDVIRVESPPLLLRFDGGTVTVGRTQKEHTGRE